MISKVKNAIQMRVDKETETRAEVQPSKLRALFLRRHPLAFARSDIFEVVCYTRTKPKEGVRCVQI